MYFVFRRSDDYVHAINASTRRDADRRLSGHPTVTFEIIGEFTEWTPARAMIEVERAKSPVDPLARLR